MRTLPTLERADWAVVERETSKLPPRERFTAFALLYIEAERERERSV